MAIIPDQPPKDQWIDITKTPPPVDERVVFKKMTGEDEITGIVDWGYRQPNGTYRMELTLPDEPFEFTHWARWGQ